MLLSNIPSALVVDYIEPAPSQSFRRKRAFNARLRYFDRQDPCRFAGRVAIHYGVDFPLNSIRRNYYRSHNTVEGWENAGQFNGKIGESTGLDKLDARISCGVFGDFGMALCNAT